MFLKDLNPGDKGKILSYGKEHPEYRRRLLMVGAVLRGSLSPIKVGGI